MKKNYAHVLAFFYGSPWAILPRKLSEIETVLVRRIASDPSEIVQLEQFRKKPAAFDEADDMPAVQGDDGPGYRVVGNAAIIPITGTITPRPSLFEEWSGGCSHSGIGRATEAAVNDGKVETIIYEIDSPGGVVFGMVEGAEKVAAATKKKPTIAVANYVAASAAYWYMSQCGELVVSPTGMVGCIGVLMANTDMTKALEMQGVRADLVANDSSPFKSEGYPQVPVTPEALADLKSQCNAYAEMFVNAIAKGRGIRPATVERDFGRGRTLLAKDALDARMVDKIESMETVVTRVTRPSGRAARRAVAAALVANKLPTA
jgi:signal peptide peptidase SppA